MPPAPRLTKRVLSRIFGLTLAIILVASVYPGPGSAGSGVCCDLSVCKQGELTFCSRSSCTVVASSKSAPAWILVFPAAFLAWLRRRRLQLS